MRRVPQYAVIGNGRVAKHLCYYFSELGIAYQQWHRQSPNPPETLIQNCSHILLAISDSTIEPFIKSYPAVSEKVCIHFSGALSFPKAYSAHPLMTFNDALLTIDQYRVIPFILDEDSPDFKELFPALENPSFKIKKELKAYYHSLCVMANNFTTLLWQKFYTELKDTFSIPSEYAQTFAQQTFLNILDNPAMALTGPLLRNDKETIDKNIQALTNDSFQRVYQAFTKTYEEIKSG